MELRHQEKVFPDLPHCKKLLVPDVYLLSRMGLQFTFSEVLKSRVFGDNFKWVHRSVTSIICN